MINDGKFEIVLNMQALHYQLNGHEPKSYETIGSVAGVFFNIY